VSIADQSVEALRADVSNRRWFHTIDLGDGLVTDGYDQTIDKTPHMHLPADLTGKTVLDIGAYEGAFSFEAKRRGAERVLATDSFVWEWPDDPSRQNFETARRILGLEVEDQLIRVEDLAPETVGTFDVVLFLGVLYHAPDPLGYLERVRSVTGGVAIIETVVDMLHVDVPASAYYAADSLNGDSSNFFGPNAEAMKGMLLDVGFTRVEAFDPWTTNRWYSANLVAPPTGLVGRARRVASAGFDWLSHHVSDRSTPPPFPRSGRMTFRAYVEPDS
jgi:tRNA (mo5U34)-methyltransferase